MSEKNLPIMVVMPNESDSQRNMGGGAVKFFGEVTEELKKNVADQFVKL